MTCVLLRALALAIVGSLALACTATRTREFARESYKAPQALTPPARVFAAERSAVDRALREVLEARGVSAAEDGVYHVPWTNSEEARASVDLGTFHRTITLSERSYRSWSPLHFRCDACVIENGNLTGETTKLLEDAPVTLDADRYRLDARLEPRTETVRSGIRLELAVRIQADPRDPPDLTPVSTGQLEAGLFDAIEAALLR